MSCNRNHFSVRQGGFALVDVLVASLVLAVGVLAFFKLENINIQRATVTNYRLQAAGVANTFIEMARANPYWLENMSTSTAILATEKTVVATDACMNVDINDETTWCKADDSRLMANLSQRFQQLFFESFNRIEGKAVFCAMQGDSSVGTSIPLRLIVIWKNASPHVGFEPAQITDCPTNYSDNILQGSAESNKTLNTASPDRGYIEIYTRI